MRSLFKESQRKWWVLLGVSIASFLGCIDFTIVNTALPSIQLALKANVNQLQWIINIFILALSACMVIMGRLADIYGRRFLLYIGMIVFGISSLGAGLANHIDGLIFFRLLQGISCAILYTASGAIVANAFPVEERGKAIGTLFGVNGIGLAIGPVFGGILISALSWRWIFLINIPAICLSLLICFKSVRESHAAQHLIKIDWAGLVILVITLSCFVLGITQIQTLWGLSLVAFSVLMFFLFYKVEINTSFPIIEFHLFVNRFFINSILATFFLALFYCLAFFLMPLYLQNILHENGYKIGLMLLPTTAMVAILSPLVGRFTDILGSKTLLIIGFIFFTLSAFFQAQLSENVSFIYIFFAFSLMGVGWACVLGPSTVAALTAVPEKMGAVAMGTSWTLHNIGGTIGLSIGVLIYYAFAQYNLIHALKAQAIHYEPWMHEAIMNPGQAVSLLKHYTQLDMNQIFIIFNNFFLAGYHAAMWFLCATSLFALIIISFFMKKTI